MIKLDNKRPDAHLEIAEILTSLGDAQGALRAFKGAINADPKASRARCQMGETLVVRLGDVTSYLKRGVKVLERCVKMNPSYPNAYKYLGHAYRQLHKYKRAVASYRRHLESNPYDMENDLVREFLEDMGAPAEVQVDDEENSETE